RYCLSTALPSPTIPSLFLSIPADVVLVAPCRIRVSQRSSASRPYFSRKQCFERGRIAFHRSPPPPCGETPDVCRLVQPGTLTKTGQGRYRDGWCFKRGYRWK